jgi:hypothetical protein
MRDLAQVMAHVHDAEIEISEEPAPPRERNFTHFFCGSRINPQRGHQA